GETTTDASVVSSGRECERADSWLAPRPGDGDRGYRAVVGPASRFRPSESDRFSCEWFPSGREARATRAWWRAVLFTTHRRWGDLQVPDTAHREPTGPAGRGARRNGGAAAKYCSLLWLKQFRGADQPSSPQLHR